VARQARANARFGATLATGDFNNDGWDDLAVGAPGDKVMKKGAGSVTVLYGSKPGLSATGSQVWTQNSRDIKGTSGSGDSFGASLAVGDFDGDGFDDLAIGAPHDSPGGLDRAGVVNVIYGGAKGLTGAGNQLFSQANTAITGSPHARDNFGSDLAAADFDSDGRDDLAIGVPGERVAGKWRAGLVHVVQGSGSGLSTSDVATWHADSPGIGGTADSGDQLGASLAAGDFNRDGFADLAIGHPGESIPSAAKTGAVTVLYGTGSSLRAVGSDLWLQGHDGLPALAEANDYFGEYLRATDLDGDGHADLIVGIPSEDLDVARAGVVMVIYGENGGLQSGGAQIWYEESPGLAGTANAGDGLGTL
jgi:hypothetical protein